MNTLQHFNTPTLQHFKETLNALGSQAIPFLFMVDFEMEKPVVMKLGEVDPEKILFDVNGFKNAPGTLVKSVDGTPLLEKKPIPFEAYNSKFNTVYGHLSYGDSYLTNLTTKTEVKIDRALRDLFFLTKAKYKLLYNDQFLVFSPETFVQIREGKIFSFPMKGTIDATLPGAKEKILNDQKELSEHVTIVDLIRNDLSQVASDVSVTRFRYVDKLETNNKDLLQVSSEISGRLPDDHWSRLGDILVAMLPAGSVSGAPKPKTISIIKKAEQEKRGYYTGIFGYFDGTKLDSGVMIRFIEKQDSQFFYRSGGGITTQSSVESEYQEMIDKVYVPLT
jgi:para-aminobenzoate synthetase component 1